MEWQRDRIMEMLKTRYPSTTLFCAKYKYPKIIIKYSSSLISPLITAHHTDPDNIVQLCRLIYRDYYMAIFISYPISTWDTHISPRADAWYGVWYENWHIIIYLSYIFLSEKFAYLISYSESKARPQSAPNVVIWVFCPTWPGDMGFLPEQKSCITNVIHYHTFLRFTREIRAFIESHVCITYAKWTYFLVNVW